MVLVCLLLWIGKKLVGNMFVFLLGFIALFIAGCSAFFSVQGLATLYSAKFLEVCIMAGGLEAGKLIAASFLHRYWSVCGILIKCYLTLSVLVLMGITSLGIFGFLTSAFQESHSKIELAEVKRESLSTKANFIQNEILSLNQRITTLNDARTSQEKRLPNMSSKSAKPIYEDIAKSGEEISKIRERIENLNNELFEINQTIVETKIEDSKKSDIGTLKYVANLFNVSVDDVVKWFTIIIVLVFDPLAVSLVLAYSVISKKEIPKKEKPEDIEKKYKIEKDILADATYRA